MGACIPMVLFTHDDETHFKKKVLRDRKGLTAHGVAALALLSGGGGGGGPPLWTDRQL